MKRTILWLIFLTAMILYGLLIYSWWVEGTYNQKQQVIDQQMQELRLYKR